MTNFHNFFKSLRTIKNPFQKFRSTSSHGELLFPMLKHKASSTWFNLNLHSSTSWTWESQFLRSRRKQRKLTWQNTGRWIANQKQKIVLKMHIDVSIQMERLIAFVCYARHVCSHTASCCSLEMWLELIKTQVLLISSSETLTKTCLATTRHAVNFSWAFISSIKRDACLHANIFM